MPLSFSEIKKVSLHGYIFNVPLNVNNKNLEAISKFTGPCKVLSEIHKIDAKKEYFSKLFNINSDHITLNKNYNKLKNLNLDQACYMQKILDNPDNLILFKKHHDKFLKLNQLQLNQPHYVQKVLDNPKQFEENYNKLKNLNLDQVCYVQKILDNPDNLILFKKHHDKFLKLNQLQLNQSHYVQKVLDNPKQFEENYNKLKNLNLDQACYVQKILDNPDNLIKFEESCNNIKQLKNGLEKAKKNTGDSNKKIIVDFLLDKLNKLNIGSASFNTDINQILKTAARTMSHHTNVFKSRLNSSMPKAYQAAQADFEVVRNSLCITDDEWKGVLKDKSNQNIEKNYQPYRIFKEHIKDNKVGDQILELFLKSENKKIVDDLKIFYNKTPS